MDRHQSLSPKPTTDQLQAAAAVNNSDDAAANNKVKTRAANSSSSASSNEDESHDVISSTVNLDQQRREFACNFCEKKFRTKQALGGHQNAHKAERRQQSASCCAAGSSMTSLIFNSAHLGSLAGYYPPRHHPYAPLLHDFNRSPHLAFNNNAANAVNNHHHRPLLGFAANVPACRFVGSNVYGGRLTTLVPPARGPSLMMARVPASNYVRFPGRGGANMNPIPPAAGLVNFAGHVMEEEDEEEEEEEEADADETGLDLSLKLGYSNRG